LAKVVQAAATPQALMDYHNLSVALSQQTAEKEA
jgi:hypothetical protein